MKIPTKTVEVRDWDSLWEHIEGGKVVFLDDMTAPDTRAFNMWLRRYKKLNARYVSLLTGGIQVTVGKPLREGAKP